ncbi:MAG: NUDIX hydrolase [Alphaproteobacteria bacterium]
MSGKKQIAALPFVLGEHGIEFYLITSRETGRWIVPKGWPKKGLRPCELAEREAFEEAGLKGRIERKPSGQFSYVKRLEGGKEIVCVVAVYAMLVEEQATSWPEKGQRQGRWAGRAEAVRLISDPELAALIKRYQPSATLTKKAA